MKSNKDLTDTQMRALVLIHELTGKVRKVGKDEIGVRLDVLERLRESGHIHSAAPFAYRFHTVTLTDLGLAALPRSVKDDEPDAPAPAGP